MFDMDGTLVDSAPAIISRLSETLEHFDVSGVKPDALRHYIGPPIRTTLSEFIAAERVPDAISFYRGLSARDGLSRQTLFDGITEVLSELHEFNVPLGIASSKPQHEVELIAEHFGIAPFFSAMVGSDTERDTKALVVAEALAKLAALSVEHPLMVGDRIWDIEGAAALGVPTILVSWGYADNDEKKTAYAEVSTMVELTQFVVNGAAS